MKSLVHIFALLFSYLMVTSLSHHIVSDDFGHTNLKIIKNNIIKTIIVDHSGHGDFRTVQAAIDSVPSGNDQWIKISIRNGIYNEKIMIPMDKPKIMMEGSSKSECIIQYNEGGNAINSSTFRLYAQYFVAVSITFKNVYNMEKPVTSYGEIKVAPAVMLGADKAAFYNCGFMSIQDTVGDLIGRHYFRRCYIKGAIDIIWGGGQSIYQDCGIDVVGVTTEKKDNVNGGILAGFITAQGRNSKDDPSGFVFNQCSIKGAGKAYLGRAYRSHSRVFFCYTLMEDVIVPQGWDPWTYTAQVEKFTYAEVNCKGEGAKKEGRVEWEKNLSMKDVDYFINPKTFIDLDGWIETLPN